MPAIVFPASGQTFKITGSDDFTSNATSWYVNDLNILTTTNNTSTTKTYDFANDIISLGSIHSVKVFTTTTTEIVYDTINYFITGSDENSSNFIPYYINELNILTVARNNTQIRTFYFNNYFTNLGNYIRVRITGSLYSEDIDVIRKTNNSFTIAIPNNWPLNFLGLTVRIGRYNYTPITAYSNDISVTTNTNRSFTINRPIGFPEVGSTIYAIIPYGIQGIADLVGINSTLTNAVSTTIFKPLTEASTVSRVVSFTKGFKVELKNDQIKNTFANARSIVKAIEPALPINRSISYSTITNIVYSNPIQITGRSGVTSDFVTYYTYENNQVILNRNTSNIVTLYFNNPNNNQSIGSISSVQLISPRFNIILNPVSYTADSITVIDIFGFDTSQSTNSTNNLFVRLGVNFVQQLSTISNYNSVPLMEKWEIGPIAGPVGINLFPVSKLNSAVSLKETNSKITQGIQRFVTNLKDTITYQPQTVVTPASTSLLFSNLIDIGGTTKTTSTYVTYYVNEQNTLTTYTASTTTTTLLFATTVAWAPAPSVVKLYAYRIVDNTENPVYDIILPVVSVNSQSVTVNWQTFEYRLRVQLGSVITISGGTSANYFTGGLAVANLGSQRFRASTNHVFTIGQGGVLRTMNQKLSAITIPLAVSKFNQSIVIRGEGRTIPQRTTVVSTATALILDPFPIYVWGKTETTSTVVRWYYNEEDILRTTNSTSSLITLYFDGLPIYQQTSAPFIKLFAPNAGYDYVYPVVTATFDSVTVQNIGIFPSVSGMYFYWARQRQTESYRYNDVGLIPQLNAQKFTQFQDPTTNKVYSSFTSTEQGWIVYDRRVTNIAYVGTSTELTLNSAIDVPVQGQYAKIQYVDNNYYRTVPNTRRAVRFNGIDTFIRFSNSTVIGAQPSRTTPIMAEAWINLDAAEGCIIMSEEYSGGADPITLTLAVGNGPGTPGTRVWFGFNDGVGWAYGISARSLEAGRWYHVAGQFDGTQIRIYIDGIQDGTPVTPIAGWNTTANAGTNFFVGRRWDTFAGDGQRPFFRGLIYQARVVVGQLVYTKNFVPSLNTTLIENSGFTKFLACAFPINQPVAQNWVGFSTPISYTIGGALTFEVASIPPRYTFDAYPEEVYEINSATSTKIYLKGRIAYRPITNTEYLQDDFADRPINIFDIYFLGISENYTVIRSTATATTSSFVSGSIRQNVPRVGFGIEIPRSGTTLSIPKLRETQSYGSKFVVSVNSVTQMTFSTTPLPVYGITQTTSTFVSYYINESNTLVTIPTGTALVTLYLGLNPEYYRPLGTTIRIVNSNNGYDAQYNIVSSTVDTVTIANARDLPSVSGMVIYYGSVQTSYPSVNFLDSNTVGRINKNTVGQSWSEITRETSGQVRQSLIVRGEPVRFRQDLMNKSVNVLRSTIEIPREFKFSTAPKIADPGRYQNPTYSTITGTETIFYSPIGLGRIASTTTFVAYYIYENNTIRSIYSTGTQKVFNFSESINPSVGFNSVRIQGYRFETVGENIIFDITLPIAAITTNTVAVNFPETFPDLLYRASLGKTFTSFIQVFSGTNSISMVNSYKTPVVENDQRPLSIGVMNKPVTVIRDLQPNNNFQIGNYGQAKIRVAGDRTYGFTTSTITYSTNTVYIDPIQISGTSQSQSDFVQYYLSDSSTLNINESTSSLLTLFLAHPIPYNGQANKVKIVRYGSAFYIGDRFFVANTEFETVYPIITYTTSSVTINISSITSIDLKLGSLAAYIGYDYQQPNSISYRNSSTLDVTLLSYYKSIIGISTFALSTYSERLLASTLVKGIDVPIQTISFKPKYSSTLKGFTDNIKTNKFSTIPIVKDGYYPNLSIRTRTVTTATTIVYEPDVYRIFGTNLTTSSFVNNYIFETNTITTAVNTASTITLFLGILPVIDPGLGLYVRITNFVSFNTVTQVLSRTAGSIVINTPIGLPNISSLFLYFGALRNVETVNYADNNFQQLNLFSDPVAGIAYRKDLISYPTFTPITVSTTGTSTFFSLNYNSFNQGQQSFTTPGTYTWIAPAGVYSVSVVAVGGGGRGGFGGQSATYKASGGGGGGLGYRNNISVVPGQAYTVVVGAGGSTSIAVAADTSSLGANGGDSFFINASLVLGRGGTGGGSSTVSPVGGGFIGDGGGTGGTGGSAGQNAQAGGGGGAGGYTGNGGDAGGFAFSSPGAATATAGSGGGGGGGDKGNGRANESPGYAGGGVGLSGLGSNGAAGSSGVGGGGSNGGNGILATDIGGAYGGGGPANNGSGGSGAVRIIWGAGRSYPSTIVADVNVVNSVPKPGDYVKIVDLTGSSIITQINESTNLGITVPTTSLTPLIGSSSTWSLILWDPSFVPQAQVRTLVNPTTPRELFYYSNISAIKYGRKLTVYPNDAASPVNIIPDKTRIVTTSTGIVWNYRFFNIYGTNLTSQTNLSWYTNDGNFVPLNPNTSSHLVLYFGSVIGGDAAVYFSNSHIRLINRLGYDQTFAIVTTTNDSVTISNPISLPSISTLKALFGSSGTVETLIWNDQGIVPTFTTNLSTSLSVTKLILAGGDLITLPYSFKVYNNIKESENFLTRPVAKINEAFTASSATYINTRPTKPRERLALALLAPGLRYNRTITQGITFSDFGNNINANPLRSSITIRPASNVDNVFSADNVNTATNLTSGINSSPKSILYYTNIAPGIRGGTYFSITNREIFESHRRAGLQDLIPRSPEILGDFERLELTTLPFEPLGAMNKPVVSLDPGNFSRIEVSKLTRSIQVMADSLPMYSIAKLGNLQEDKFQTFFIDNTLSLIDQPAKFIDLRAVNLDWGTGKLKLFANVNPGVEVGSSPFGIFKRIDKVGTVQTILHDIGELKISSEGIHEPLDIQLTVNVRGLITKFTASKSGNLHDPSTKRIVPIQFWN